MKVIFLIKAQKTGFFQNKKTPVLAGVFKSNEVDLISMRF